jgi:Na+-transporting NADH:ubiquinone oxidoreductase subunit C
MENKTDSNPYTLLFAVAMVVAVGSILAFLAAVLKEKISENKRLEKQQNILYAMGVNENDDTSAIFVSTDKVGAEWTNYIKKQIIIQNSEISEDDNAYLIDIKKEKTLAKDPSYSRRLPLFVGEKKREEILCSSYPR